MLGCHRLLEPGDGPALIFDIGGGSTELVLIDTDEGEPRIRCWWSAPWGVVSLTDSEGRNFATVEERLAAYGRMRERVRHAFRHFLDLLPKGRDGIRLMGTSGTVTTLASVYLSLPSYDRRAVDGLKMPASAMRGISETLSAWICERAHFCTLGALTSSSPAARSSNDHGPLARRNPGVADRGIAKAYCACCGATGINLEHPQTRAAGRTRKTAKGRKIGSTRWLERRQRPMSSAPERGLPRAAYKLVELDERFNFKGAKGRRLASPLALGPIVRQRLPSGAGRHRSAHRSIEARPSC